MSPMGANLPKLKTTDLEKSCFEKAQVSFDIYNSFVINNLIRPQRFSPIFFF